jgi:hypothetical protein
MSCACVRNANRQLRDSHARLVTLIPRGRDGRASGAPRVLVRTVNDDPDRRIPPVAVATHCPFCGTKYED